VRYSLELASDDPDEQVQQVISTMARYVREDARSIPIRQEAAALVSSGGDSLSAVFHHVKHRMRFVRDETLGRPWEEASGIPVAEVLVRPVDMATAGASYNIPAAQGDCDDYVMYAAALLRAMGIETRFVTLAADPQDPSRYSHVYLVAYHQDQRIPLDVSHGDYPGWEAPNYYGKRREWGVEDRSWIALAFVLGAAGWYWAGVARRRRRW